jgi:hypothetical protein
MTPAQLAEYFRLVGRRVVQTHACHWYEVEPRVFNSIPFHREIIVGEQELRELWKAGAVAARYPSPIDSAAGVASAHYVCTDRQYDLTRVPSANSRNHIRRGLRQCEIRALSADELSGPGWSLHEKTIARQRRLRRRSERRSWQRQVEAMQQVGGFEFFGAFADARLAALAVGFQIEHCYQISTVRSDPELFAQYPNDALIHDVLVRAMRLRQVEFASYGFESLRAKTDGLHRFKLGLGFTARPVKQSVSTRRWIRPMLPVLHAVARAGRYAVPQSALASQLERVVAFALATARST